MGMGRRLHVGEGGRSEREDDAGAALWTPRREVGHGEQGPEATAASLGSDSGEVRLGGARAWAEWDGRGMAVGGDRTRGERRGGVVAHPRCRGSGAARLAGAVEEEDGDEATTERTPSKESGEESRRGSATRQRRGGGDEVSERRRCSGDGGVQRRGGDGAVVSAAAAGRSLRSNRGAGEGRCGSREREAWGSWGGEWGDL
nr:spidroin-1-like [Aegilops tauschii subsp. strangulata]